MRIDFPVPAQYAQLMALWQEAFGDSEEFVDGFFCTGFSPARCRCVTDNGNVVGALYWFDGIYRGQRFAYVYAVAVKKTHRGKGICTALMQDTHAHLQLRGYDGILLMPQNGELRAMYDKLGYTECTKLRRFTCEAGVEAVALRRIDRDEYAALRRKFLPADGVRQEEENIAYLEMMAFFYAGEDFLLAAHKNSRNLYCPELLGNTDAAPGILTALGCTEGSFRTPGDSHPGTMLHVLTDKVSAPGYFGLTFE
jgi:ribosomal protein S18 acetylase RimI-like enzyme